MKTAIAAGLFLALMLGLGIAFQIKKTNDCEEAGWDYHWVTEQCLPKKVNGTITQN